MAAITELEQMLRGASLRVTQPRIAVLAAVHEHPHAETSAVIADVRGRLGDVSTQAVYDVLSALHGAGLIRRIQPEGSVARYEARTGDNHHHVVCRSCGAIADVDCAVGHTPCLTAADDHGFQIDEAEVIYWGHCPHCRTSHTTAGPSSLAHADHTHGNDTHGQPAADHPHGQPVTDRMHGQPAADGAYPPTSPEASPTDRPEPAERGASVITPPTSSEPPRGSHV